MRANVNDNGNAKATFDYLASFIWIQIQQTYVASNVFWVLNIGIYLVGCHIFYPTWLKFGLSCLFVNV